MNKQRVIDLSYQINQLEQIELSLERLQELKGVLTDEAIDGIYKQINKARAAAMEQRDEL